MITASNVQQTSTTTGTGNLTLAAPDTGFRAFSDVMTYGTSGGTSGEDWAPYYAQNADGSEWELGVARLFNDAGNGELARATGVVLESSNSDALVSFTGDTTIRLVTPPYIEQYKRGVKVFLSSTQSIDGVGGSGIDWDTEQSDTDDCWSGTNADRLYIPAWAEEVEIWFYGSTGNTTRTDNPVIAYVYSSGCERSGSPMNEQHWPILWTDSANDIMEGGGAIRIRVNRSVIHVNNRAYVTIEEIDPSNSALVWSADTRAWLRVIR